MSDLQALASDPQTQMKLLSLPHTNQTQLDWQPTQRNELEAWGASPPAEVASPSWYKDTEVWEVCMAAFGSSSLLWLQPSRLPFSLSTKKEGTEQPLWQPEDHCTSCSLWVNHRLLVQGPSGHTFFHPFLSDSLYWTSREHACIDYQRCNSLF